jgi:hypothetical protein
MNLSGKLIKGSGSYSVGEIAPPVESGQLLLNNKFLNWIGDDPDDFSVLNEDVNNYITEHLNGAQFVYDDDNPATLALTQDGQMTVGRYYRHKIIITDFVEGSITLTDSGGGDHATFTGAGIHYHIMKASVGNPRIYRAAGADANMVIAEWSMEEVPEGYPLMDKGMKYLECTSAGTVAFACDQAYGEWEFDLLKNDEESNARIYFIADAVGSFQEFNGYMIQFSSTEAISLSKINVGSFNLLALTAASYISLNTFYRLKLTRTLDGKLSIYIRGGSFGNNDWTLVNASASGSNPVIENTYTNSEYFTSDFIAGDRISTDITQKAVRQ